MRGHSSRTRTAFTSSAARAELRTKIILFFGICLSVVAFISTTSASYSLTSSNSFSSFSRRGLQEVEECANRTCAAGELGIDGCAFDEEFALVCCEAEENVSFSDLSVCEDGSGSICRADALCSVELIPGMLEGPECLTSFELGGGLAVYIFLLLYLFLAIAIVCDDYFTYALEMCGDALGLSSDVKGAVFAAMGSSAPELFVSMADNVISSPPKSLGIGTVVGSAIFNMLVIIGASSVVAGHKFGGDLVLDWRPLLRDSFFYVLSISALITIVLTGEVARHYEGFLLMALYALYLTFMAFNSQFFAFLDRKLGLKKGEGEGDDQTEPEPTLKRQPTGTALGKGILEDDFDVSYFSVFRWPWYTPEGEEKQETKIPDPEKQEQPKQEQKTDENKGQPLTEPTTATPETKPTETKPTETKATTETKTTTEVVENDTNNFLIGAFGGGFKLWLRRCYYIFVFPINFVFRFTIPDARYDLLKEDRNNGRTDQRHILYTIEFIMCIFWIAILSYLVVFCGAKFGCIVGIDPAILGLTLLAAGTSVPDMITSILLTVNGEGDAAIANSLGSNCFDILIGLGLPWFLAEFVHGEGAPVAADDLTLAIGFLFGVFIILITSLLLTNFRLNTRIGIFFMCLYLVYIFFELVLKPLLL